MTVFDVFPVLETENFLLRQTKQEDAPLLYRMARDPEVSRYTFWETHRSLRESQDVIEMFRRDFQERKAITWAAQHKKTAEIRGFIGVINIDEVSRSLEIGFWLGREFWGRGYMPELLQAVIKFCIREMGVERVQAKHVIENPASGRVMQKAGMTCEGTLRRASYCKERFWDTAVYSILAGEES